MAKESTRHRKARKQRQKRIREFQKRNGLYVRKVNPSKESVWTYFSHGGYEYKKRLNADGTYTFFQKTRALKVSFKEIKRSKPNDRALKFTQVKDNSMIKIEKRVWNEYSAMNIAETMKVEDMIRARKNGCPWNEYTCQMAAKADNMDMMKYLHENGCPWNEWASFSCRSLKMLKYLHENGCPWDSKAMDNAALRGDVEMLSYLFDNGCPLGDCMFKNAAFRGHLNVIQFLLDKGLFWKPKDLMKEYAEYYMKDMAYTTGRDKEEFSYLLYFIEEKERKKVDYDMEIAEYKIAQREKRLFEIQNFAVRRMYRKNEEKERGEDEYWE